MRSENWSAFIIILASFAVNAKFIGKSGGYKKSKSHKKPWEQRDPYWFRKEEDFFKTHAYYEERLQVRDRWNKGKPCSMQGKNCKL